MTELREIAKANGITSVTTMRKESLIDKILEAVGMKEGTVATTAAPVVQTSAL